MQNGRVSPRKYAQSDKSSTSPAHPGNSSAAKEQNQNQNVTSAPSTEKQSGGDANPAANANNMIDDDTIPGNVPSRIDEGEEPPHPSVLPT
jgi:hypothetical protein